MSMTLDTNYSYWGNFMLVCINPVQICVKSWYMRWYGAADILLVVDALQPTAD